MKLNKTNNGSVSQIYGSKHPVTKLGSGFYEFKKDVFNDFIFNIYW